MVATKQPDFQTLYAALERRSPEFDGLFFTAVKTTKIFCRPICPARTPFAKNVEFFATTQEALHAGYRACKRCKPLDMGQQKPDWVDTLRERIEADPGRRLTDTDLRAMDLDPVQVRRVFIKSYGISFHAYQRAWRMGMALSGLRQGQDVVDVAIATDYASESGFRAAFEKIIGVAPKHAQLAEPAWAKWIETPLGSMLGVAVEDGLALLEFVDRRMLETQLKTFIRRFGRTIVPGEHLILAQTQQELNEYFDGQRRTFTVPLALRGTDFQEQVWKALITIPYGEWRSYGQQADQIGNPKAVRAVGKANGDNRISILIPCHRVMNTDGSLCGYGGGLWRKQRLLNLEQGSNHRP
ncbi:MAG: bifunctional transcriptional activator/DNA repair enzyme AdaA [Fimbriimonas sp.]